MQVINFHYIIGIVYCNATFLSLDILQQYGSEEKIAIRSVKCFLTGLPGVGKTTFLRRLSEDVVNLKLAGENPSSSTGLEAPLPVCVLDETQFSTAVVSSKKLHPIRKPLVAHVL